MVSFAFKNYYERLGVTHKASDIEIRRAFRQLAQLYHPDVAGAKQDAQEIFVLINEAHQALIDPSSRKKYDELLHSRWGRGSTPGPQKPQNSAEAETKSAPSDAHSVIRNVEWESCEESVAEDSPHATAFGWRTARDGQIGSAGRRDLDTQAYLEITLKEALLGTVHVVNIDSEDEDHPEAYSYRVKLPPGIWRGEQLRMVGCGIYDDYTDEYGDLYLRIGYAKHDHFRLMGTHIYKEVEINPWDAALGMVLPVTTLNGEANLEIPAGVQPGQRFNLKNYGMPERMGGRGDLIVSAKIRIPSANTTRQQALWQILAREYGAEIHSDI